MGTEELSGRVCFVTGSTRGIGWATAQLLARNGATVVLNGRQAGDPLEERRRKLETECGAPLLALAADASDAAAVHNCYVEIFKRYKRLDVLVNNAGILRYALLGMMTPEFVREMLDTNVFGALMHLQEASRLMSRHGRGSIINVSSIIGRMGHEGHTVYAASKAAVIGMTLSAAKELAPKGIRVNAVAPGLIDTDMARELPPEKLSARISSIGIGRVGTPEEVAEAILFLASDASSYVTGQVLGVDGAMVM